MNISLDKSAEAVAVAEARHRELSKKDDEVRRHVESVHRDENPAWLSVWWLLSCLVSVGLATRPFALSQAYACQIPNNNRLLLQRPTPPELVFVDLF